MGQEVIERGRGVEGKRSVEIVEGKKIKMSNGERCLEVYRIQEVCDL